MDRQPSGRLDALDGLRGLAAVTVLVWHVCDRVAHDWVAPATAPSLIVADLGKDAVSLFFVLSGFLLARPLLAWLIGQRERPSMRRYLQARLLRILPAWLLVVAVVVPLTRPDLLRAPADLLSLATLTYMSFDTSAVRYVVPQSWTLTIEIAVYAALPLVALAAAPLVRRLAPARRPAAVAGGLLAVVALSLLWKHALYTPDGRPVADVRPLNHLVPAYADHFALGALAALAVLCGRGPTGRRAALAGFALFAAGATTAGDLALRGESRALVAAGLACVVLAAATARGGVAVGTLASAPSALLGRRSYGIYLWHYAVLETAFALGLVHVGSPVLVVAAGLLLVSLALAEVSWRLVESPALALAARRRDERPARLDAPDTGGERARPVPYDGSPWHPSRSRSSPATASAPR